MIDLFTPDRQGDLFDAPAAPRAQPVTCPDARGFIQLREDQSTIPDPLGERIVAAGLSPSTYLLGLNDWTFESRRTGLPWAIPSRLMEFPIATWCPQRHHRDHCKVFPRQLGLLHPDLANHPWVREAEEKLGMTIPREPPRNLYGACHQLGSWWHAVDLASAGYVDELLATRSFTTDADIEQAISHALHGKDRLSLPKARLLLRAIGLPQPEPDYLRQVFNPPELISTGERSKGWAVRDNWQVDAKGERVLHRKAWGYVIGLERGWIGYQGGFAHWTDAGRQWWQHGTTTLL